MAGRADVGIYLDDGGWDRAMYSEACRQRAVDRAQPMRFRDDRRLQRIVCEAARAYGTAAAAISIIDWQEQIFVARTGIEADGTSRSDSFCAIAIHQPGEPLIVADATRDPRFSAMPSVLAPPGVRFYAGNAIVDRAGYSLGALCVFDPEPREAVPDPTELALLSREVERIIAR